MNFKATIFLVVTLRYLVITNVPDEWRVYMLCVQKEAAYFSETLINNYQPTRHHIPKGIERLWNTLTNS